MASNSSIKIKKARCPRRAFFISSCFAEDHETAHFVVAVLGRDCVNLLDQTGQGAADLPGEDHRDRIFVVPSDEACHVAGIRAVTAPDLERFAHDELNLTDAITVGVSFCPPV